jgi:type II secretory pathway component GspD/PulD (secretin)
LGDIWMIGRLFQRRTVDRERSEVIVALLPRIVPCECESNHVEAADVARTQLPILTPELQPSPRPEPSLPDALRNPIRPLR